jgi:small subunit ribosomal protein S6
MKKAVTTPSPMMKEEKSRSMNIGADDAKPADSEAAAA